LGKNILVIDGHPDPEQSRFCHVLAATYANAAQSAGHSVKILEISRLDYVATPPSQFEVVAYLSKAENYPAKPATVEGIDTHGAMDFLAGDEV
jgi:putative NADPH-quinone reductase